MNLNEIHTKHDLILTNFKEIVKKFFPEPMVTTQNFDVIVSELAKNFQNSKYYYSDKLEFIHFTTLNNLFSILNEGALRFYNLNNSNDPNEFFFSLNLLNLGITKVDYFKSHTYTFSFCPLSESGNKYLWEKYANNYQGIGIHFEIKNNLCNWKKYYLSPIIYEQINNLELFSTEINQFKSKYNLPSNCLDFNELARIFCFHKEGSWNKEKEVRLLTYFPFNNISDYARYSIPSYRYEMNRNRFVEHISLKLWENIKTKDFIYKNRINNDFLVLCHFEWVT